MQKESRQLYIQLEMIKVFLSIIFATIIFNFFISGILNANSQINNLRNIDFISAELQNNLSKEQKRELEIKLLNVPEIKKVTYVNSYIAFENLQKDLGIVLPKGDNPLSDSLRIYVKSINNIQKIQEILDSTQEIKEYFLDTTYSDNVNKKIKFFEVALVGLTLGAISLIFIIITIASIQFKVDYIGSLINNGYNKNFLLATKRINLLPCTLAVLIGMFFFSNVYTLCRSWFITNDITSSLLTTLQIAPLQIISNIILITLIWLIPVKERWEN